MSKYKALGDAAANELIKTLNGYATHNQLKHISDRLAYAIRRYSLDPFEYPHNEITGQHFGMSYRLDYLVHSNGSASIGGFVKRDDAQLFQINIIVRAKKAVSHE